MCQDNESIPVSGCSDLKTGPDHGWNLNELDLTCRVGTCI